MVFRGVLTGLKDPKGDWAERKYTRVPWTEMKGEKCGGVDQTFSEPS